MHINIAIDLFQPNLTETFARTLPVLLAMEDCVIDLTYVDGQVYAAHLVPEPAALAVMQRESEKLWVVHGETLNTLLSTIPEKNRGRVIHKFAGDPATQVCESSAAHHLLVVMCHGRTGINRWLLGSVAEKIVRISTVPVLVLRPWDDVVTMTPPERMLFAIDLHDSDPRGSVQGAAYWAGQFGAKLDLLYITEDFGEHYYTGYDPDGLLKQITKIRQKQRDDLELLLQEIPEETRGQAEVLPNPKPGDTIVRMAKEHDIVSVQTHGRTGLQRFFMGSVAQRVTRHASIPTLVLRGPK